MNMFYKLECAGDLNPQYIVRLPKDTTGSYTQVENLAVDALPKSKLDISHIELSKLAYKKKPDMIYTGMVSGLFVSERLFELLQKFNYGDTFVQQIDGICEGKSLKFYYYYPKPDIANAIDFSQSFFCKVRSSFLGEVFEIEHVFQVRSYAEYVQFKTSLGNIERLYYRPLQLAFYKDIWSSVDIFGLNNYLGGGCYVNMPLMMAIDNLKPRNVSCRLNNRMVAIDTISPGATLAHPLP